MDSRQQTLRVAGLPRLTQESDVRQFFEERITRRHGRNIVESVGPICDHANRQTKRTTVSFSSHSTAQKALELPPNQRRLSAERGGVEQITIDSTFRDLTTLHSKDNPATGKPDVEYVFLFTFRRGSSRSASTQISLGSGLCECSSAGVPPYSSWTAH